jgi:hypothetical protein
LKIDKPVAAKKFNKALRKNGFSEKVVRNLLPKHGCEKYQDGWQGPWFVERKSASGSYDTRK